MERKEPEQVTVVRGNQNEEFSFLLYEFLTRDVVREHGIHILCFFFFFFFLDSYSPLLLVWAGTGQYKLA